MLENLFLGFQGVGSDRTWCAQTFLPVCRGLIGAETVWSPTRAQRKGTADWDDCLADFSSLFSVSRNLFFCKGGELLYLQLCNVVRQRQSAFARCVRPFRDELMANETEVSLLYSRTAKALEKLLDPLSRLAPKYGLSDVGLAKTCRKYNIPRPGLGYWTRVKHGAAVGPDKLPDPEDDPSIVIRAHQPPATSDSGHSGFKNIFDRALMAEAYWPKIVVGPTTDPHDLVTTSLTLLRFAKQDDCGRYIPEYKETLDVLTTKKARRRAHRILHTLFRALEDRGYSVHLAYPKTTIRYCSLCSLRMAADLPPGGTRSNC